MSTNQLFFAIAGLLVALFGMTITTVKWYLDAKFQAIDDKFKGVDGRFDGVNGRFDGVDGQLRFLIEHAFNHAERIAALEAKSK